MTLVEFLAASRDPASSISKIGFAEFRNWMLLFGYWEGKQIRPIVSQTRQQLEAMLLTTELVMPDSSDPAETIGHVFNLTHRVTPLTAPPAANPPTANPSATAPSVAERLGRPPRPIPLAGQSARDFVNEAMRKARVAVLAHRPDAHSIADLPPQSDYARRLVESVVGPGAAPNPLSEQAAPPPQPVPQPSNAEDQQALAAITAEHDRLTAKAVQLFGLASPPAQLLTGLIADLQNQISNFEAQQQMIAPRRDLAAFPVMLTRVLNDLGFDLRRCQALLMKVESQDLRGPLAPRPRPLAGQTAAPQPVPPPPPSAPQPDPVAVYKQHLAELNAAHEAEMHRRQVAFEKGQAEHKALVDMYQRQNDAWAKAFFGR